MGSDEIIWKPDIDRIPAQGDFIRSDAMESLFCGGIRGGKTYGGAIKAALYCIANPGADGVVTGPTNDVLTQATFPTYMQAWPEALIKVWRPADRILETNNGNKLFFRSTHEWQTALVGFTVAFGHMDEAALSEYESYLRLHGRLSQPGFKPMLWLTTTPKGHNWVYREFVLKGPKPIFYSSARLNPFLGGDYISRLERQFAGKLALQEIEGQFTLLGESFFDVDALNRAFQEDVREPIYVEENGLLQVWKHPEASSRYIVGADCWGGGEGAEGSNAVTEVVDALSGEQVARLHGKILPDQQAEWSVKLCRKYNGAFLVFENNGAGFMYAKELMALGYNNFYYQDAQRRKPGYRTDGTNKETLLLTLDQAMRERRLTVHSYEDLQEFSNVQRDGKTIGAARDCHDDAPMAFAMFVAGQLARPFHPVQFSQPQSYLQMGVYQHA